MTQGSYSSFLTLKEHRRLAEIVRSGRASFWYPLYSEERVTECLKGRA